MKINKPRYMLWDVRVTKNTNNKTWLTSWLYARIIDLFISWGKYFIFADSWWVSEHIWSIVNKSRRILSRTKWFITDDSELVNSNPHLYFYKISSRNIEWCEYIEDINWSRDLFISNISNLEYKELLKKIEQEDTKNDLKLE